MKQLFTFLLAVFCTLSVLGQRQTTDSTHPKKTTGTNTHAGKGDSGRAGDAVPGKQITVTAKQKDRDTANAPGAAAKTGTAKASDSVPRRLHAESSTGSAAHINNTAAGRSAANTGNDSSHLTPAQIQAQKQAQEKQQLKARNDSIYAEHKNAILSGLSSAALQQDTRQPDYRLYFPRYFYENSNSESGNGALVAVHHYQNRDLLFYGFLGITLLLALIKIIFPSYFNQIFWFFLHPNDRKNNAPEQIQGQNILPSLLLNLFFVLTGGLFLTQILRPGIPGANFWSSWLLFSGLLAGVYLVKYLVILLSGWVFGTPAAATIYNQVVFSINKIIGLLLLPATVLISYGTSSTTGHVFTTVLIIISILLIYRYIASFLLIKGKLKVSAFHFILYLCAVEIIPLLLVYKVLLTNIGRFV